jgi:hypothetical protein
MRYIMNSLIVDMVFIYPREERAIVPRLSEYDSVKYAEIIEVDFPDLDIGVYFNDGSNILFWSVDETLVTEIKTLSLG